MPPKNKYPVEIIIDVTNEEQIKDLIKELEKLTAEAKKDPLTKLNKNMKQTAKQSRFLGRNLQNASYQLQDFVTQVSNGVSPLVSFGQQMPQLLVNAGAVGAVIGVVAAAVPVMVRAFGSGGDAAIDLSDSLSELTDSTSNLEKAMEDYIRDGTEFQRLIVEIESDIAQSKLLDYMHDLADALDVSAWEVWGNAVREAIGATVEGTYLEQLVNDIKSAFSGLVTEVEKDVIRIQKAAESLNINEASAASVNVIMEQFKNGAIEAETAYKALQDVLATTSRDEQNSAEGLLAVIKEIGEERKKIAGLGVLGEVEPQGRRQRRLTPPRPERQPDPLPRVVANPGTLEMRKAYEERQKMLKEEEQIMRALYPEVSAYNDQMERLAIARERNLISMPEYIRMSEEAMETLQGEQFSLAAEAIEIFDSSFQTMLDGVLAGTTSIEDGFKSMAKVIIAEMARIAAIKGIASLFGANSDIGSALLGRIGANAKGNAFSGGNVIPFAKGGVVTGPTLFPMAKGAGLMGEAGPEAVMPLTRTASGDLGVKSTGMSVVINNMASGVEVTPRQTDEGLTVDIVTRTLANSIRQGGNPLTDALEGSYSLGRGGSVY